MVLHTCSPGPDLALFGRQQQLLQNLGDIPTSQGCLSGLSRKLHMINPTSAKVFCMVLHICCRVLRASSTGRKTKVQRCPPHTGAAYVRSTGRKLKVQQLCSTYWCCTFAVKCYIDSHRKENDSTAKVSNVLVLQVCCPGRDLASYCR